ncbi:MAG: hypothetical protein ABI112_02160 [Terracoccus sp.]
MTGVVASAGLVLLTDAVGGAVLVSGGVVFVGLGVPVFPAFVVPVPDGVAVQVGGVVGGVVEVEVEILVFGDAAAWAGGAVAVLGAGGEGASFAKATPEPRPNTLRTVTRPAAINPRTRGAQADRRCLCPVE